MAGARLTSRMQIDALIRAAAVAGGHVAVLGRGDDGAGAILVQCAERGRAGPLLERTVRADGCYGWSRCGPADPTADDERIAYLSKRRQRDPDLWLIELDIADAERFAAETIP